MPTLQDVLASLDQQAASSMSQNDTELLTNLVSQDMTRGLGITPQGQPNFSGPVAGYAGPLRPSDVPSFEAGADIPVYNGSKLSPGTEQARADAGGPFRGIMPQPQAEQLMQGISSMTAAGVPQGTNKEIVEGLLGKMGIGSAATSKSAEMLNRQFLREDLSKWYDKKTGDPAGLKADEITDYGKLRQGYMKLNPTQIQNKDALATTQDTVQRYLVLAGALGLPEKPGMINSTEGALSIKYRRAQHDPVVADLDALNAQITGLAKAFGGDSRVTDKEMLLLKKAVIEDGDNMESVAAKMRTLQGFLDTKVKSSGIPWLKRQTESTQPGTQPAAAPAAASEGKAVKVSSPEEARKLPKGTLFTTPDGRTLRVK